MVHEEKEISTKDIYSCRIFDIKEHKVRLENGETADRAVLYHHGGVCILATDSDDNLYMVEQFRYPTGTSILEIPAGKLEKGENPKEAAFRELEEEIGYTTDSLTLLTEMYPTPAYCSEVIHVYRAGGLTKTHQHLDDDEFLDVKKIPFAKAVEMVMNGSIIDAKTIAGILMLNNIRNSEG